jgi:hypothetical protein
MAGIVQQQLLAREVKKTLLQEHESPEPQETVVDQMDSGDASSQTKTLSGQQGDPT